MTLQKHQAEPYEITAFGHLIAIDPIIGHLTVYHDGEVPWETLQQIKTFVWGADSRAIEVYPAESNVVNSVNARHLWLLGEADFCPDMLGDSHNPDTLENRFRRAWQEANNIFT